MTPENNQEQRVQQILWEALKVSGEARNAYLETACGGDSELRREVESLLQAEGQAGTFLVPQRRESGSAVPLAEKAGDHIGRYKLLEIIGEGGFGVVWMAEQEEPVRRRVALKIIKLGMDTKEVVARFEAERQALAMMEHPNIARVFDGGATEIGRPFFVMELVKGIPITSYCDANKLNTRERLELFMQVCQAVQHAHQKGLIHRDLKPSNILVSVRDDRPVPKVIDFGVAKATQARLTEKTLFSRFQQWIGTPAYMSPEQAGLDSLDVDTRSDIYSLGVLLYELLTGRTPFDTQKLLASGYDAVMRTVREEEPPKPSTRLNTLARQEMMAVAAQRGADPEKLSRLVRGDLDWVVMKALEKDRQRRYETAGAFARDVEHYLHQEPVTAAAPSAVYRARRFIARNRMAMGFSAALVLALLVGTVLSVWQAVRATRAEKETSTALGLAEKGRLAAEQGKRDTEAALYASRASGASQAWEKGDVKEAEELLDSCPPALRDWEWRYLKRQCHAEVLSFSTTTSDNSRWPQKLDSFIATLGGGHLLDFHAQLAFTADDMHLAARVGPLGEVERNPVFDISIGKPVPLIWSPHTNSTVILAVDGSRLVALPNVDPIARVLDLKTAKESLRQIQSASSKSLANDDASWLALPASNGVTVVGLAADSARRFVGITNTDGLQLKALSPDGTTLVTLSSSDKGYEVWDTVKDKLRFQIPFPAQAHEFRFDQRACRLAVCGPLEGPSDRPGAEVAVWDVVSGQRLFILRGLSLFTKMWFARNDQWLIMAPLRLLDQHPSTDLIIVDAASGQEMFSVVADNAVHHAGRDLWAGKPDTGTLITASGVNDVAISPDGGLMAVAVTDRTIHLIDQSQAYESHNSGTPKLRAVLRGHRGAVLAVTFSHDGKRLASVDQLGVVKVWELAKTLANQLGEDWERYTTVSGDATGVVWTDFRTPASYAMNLTTGERTTLPGFPVDDHLQVRILDRARIAVGGEIWSVPTRGRIMTLSTNKYIVGLTSTDDGHYVATIGGGEVQLWETLTGKLAGPSIPIQNETFGRPYRPELLSLTSDGSKVAVCAPGMASLVQVWRTGIGGDTAGLITNFPGRKPVLFGPNAAWLLAGKETNSFQRVDATTGKVLREYRLGSRLGVRPLGKNFEFTLLGWELSPNGQFALCYDFDRDLSVLDLLSGEVLFEVGWPGLVYPWAAFTSDSRRLLVPGRDQRVEIWSLETKSKIVTLPQRGVFIRFTRDGNRAVVISPEGQVSVLDGTPLDPAR